MAKPTAADRRHMAKVAEMPCVACGRWPVSVHHVTSDGFKRLTKRHDRVVPLCPDCHQNGPHAVHKISHAVFNQLHGFDLLAIAERLANGE
jgi:hypothetical protein